MVSISLILLGYKMAECDECEFPFKYNGIEYTKCTKLENDAYEWCITNQTLFDNSGNDWFDANGNENGWKKCKQSCDVECPTPCQFPFYFDGKKYEKCTEDHRERAWCVTDEVLFNNSDVWRSPNGSRIGWEYCDESYCEVEEIRECDISSCLKSYNIKGHLYTSCTTDYFYNSHQGWCVTNQEKFDSISEFDYQKPFGWTSCSGKCPLENTICEECEFPFEYRGNIYHSCTARDSNIIVSSSEGLPWCAVNKTEFSKSDGVHGWEYCSRDCGSKS